MVKPAGMASELTSDPKRVSLLSRVVDAGFQEARLPHRLDRGTRGFLLVALSADAIRFHNERVRERRWRKVYLARVGGSASQHESLLGEHKAYLKRRGNRMEVVRSGGQPSFLRVVGLDVAPLDTRGDTRGNSVGDSTSARTKARDCSHVVIELGTGRYHQIRAMLSALGAPLVGDHVYGGGNGPFYLEHVVFSFEPMDGSGVVTLFDPSDSDREEITEKTRATLVRCARAEGIGLA